MKSHKTNHGTGKVMKMLAAVTCLALSICCSVWAICPRGAGFARSGYFAAIQAGLSINYRMMLSCRTHLKHLQRQTGTQFCSVPNYSLFLDNFMFIFTADQEATMHGKHSIKKKAGVRQHMPSAHHSGGRDRWVSCEPDVSLVYTSESLSRDYPKLKESCV